MIIRKKKIATSIIRIIKLLLISLWLVNCTSSNNSLAPVRSVNENIGVIGNISNDMLITSLSVTSAKKRNISAIQPMKNFTTKSTELYKIKHSSQKKSSRITYNRQYANIPKGHYTGSSTYIVKYGDTLFYIAWITGNNFRDLAEKNNIHAPYCIKVGQKLQIGKIAEKTVTFSKNISSCGSFSKRNKAISKQKPATVIDSQSIIIHPKDSDKQQLTKNTLRNNKSSIISTTTPVTKSSMIDSAKSTARHTSANPSIFVWCWPTEGKIIENFSFSEWGNKGIDIIGNKGQAIVTAADGRVVYVGNALRGYGNLVIIKHNNDYLSAYAHNDVMLVREQQEVKAGQKIATMGSTGTDSARLHFEIRYKGKSVNPLQYLPQR